MRLSIPALLLTGAAVSLLAACSSSKGPGEIGSKDDIVVRNKGLPSAPVEGDFSSTVEQAQAVPAPSVEPAAMEGAPLPVDAPVDAPAVKSAAMAEQAAPVPVPSPVSSPASSPSAPAPATSGADVLPAKPVTEQATPVPAQAVEAAANALPAASAAAPTPQTAPTSAPAPASQTVTTAPSSPVKATVPQPTAMPGGMKYPLDPNAPYSPKAIAEAQEKAAVAASAPLPTPGADTKTVPTMSLSDPAMVRALQATLAAKGVYVGPQTGIVDASLLNALTKYQTDNALPVGGLNEETLRHLGIIE